MRALLLLTLSTLRGRYWLIPTVMALGAIALAFAAVSTDRLVGWAWMEEAPWLYTNGPTGARTLLSTIAGSMMTVAGVTFSITMVAIANTSSTYGPRLISNFMQDQGNQITLGTFIATFLFCILVLRTVQGDDGSPDAFVPHLAVAIALVFALASLGVLIYFMHHVPESIHISNVVASLGGGLLDRIDRIFPADAEEISTASEEADAARGAGTPVRAGKDGYLRYVDWDGLERQASGHDLFVALDRRPGAFVAARDTIATVHAASPPDEETLADVRNTFVVGVSPSPEQDLVFSIDRLVEVAARALSPGMNDIYTALGAIDWLGAGLVRLGRRRLAHEVRRDAEGQLRVVAVRWSYEELVGAVFDQLRAYVGSDRNAAVHTMRMLARVARHTPPDERRAALRMQARALCRFGDETLGDPDAREALAAAYDEALEALGAPAAEGTVKATA
ncbi:MAG TPA: DUF2254 domain-containing protein [Thermohalobaculum sp.]|nr:DUF2254 domain-containing protein [Thermohalobaculum sp.]